MPLNLAGVLVPFSLIFNPRLIVPRVVVKDIRQIDFHALKDAGYRGAIFDKDNCLTLPDKDTLVPELSHAWETCRSVFGNGNVIVVSNSAGTDLDPGGIQAESVSHHLSVPVLNHNARKPSQQTIRHATTYFSSLASPVRPNELVVIGDRLFTDVVLANRMTRPQEPHLADVYTGPLAIWTTGTWKTEAVVLRWAERVLLNAVQRWSTPSPAETRLVERLAALRISKAQPGN